MRLCSAPAPLRASASQVSPSSGLLPIGFDARKFRNPMHPALGPKLVARLGHRLGVVETAKRHRNVLALVRAPEQRRATIAAELAGRNVRGPEACRLTFGDLERITRPGHVGRQRAAGLTTALPAVADVRPGGLAPSAKPDRTAKAPTGVLDHF